MSKLSFEKFLLKESANVNVKELTSILNTAQKSIEKTEDKDDKEDLVKEFAEKILKVLEDLIENFAKEPSYLTKEQVEEVRKILDESGIKHKEVESYLTASLESDKRKAFEDEHGEDSEDDDKIAKKAKENAKDDEELEKETEKDLKELEKKVGRKPKKILLGIIKKEDDGEVLEAIVGDTELSVRDIEGLEYREDVMAAMFNARDLKTPAAITKRVKELKGDVVYFYDEKKKDNDEEFWKIVPYKF